MAPESQYPSKQSVFHCCSGSWSCEGQRWTLCVSHICFWRAAAHKLAEELVGQDPATLWLGWTSAPAPSQGVQTCVSCCKEQAAKVEAVEQESCSLSSVNVCLGAESYSSHVLTLIPYRVKWISSEWGIKSVCLVSYTPMKSSWLKAVLFNFCSLFPEYCWFYCFVLFGALIISSFFTASCQCMNRCRKR